MKKKILPYLLLAPMILIMGVLVFYPIITTFAYSLKRWKLTEPGNIHYIGFKNYIDILQSDSFKYSMQNTLFILVFVIVFTTIIGYLVSVYLNLECKCAGMLLAIAILPWALPPFVNGILWKFVFFSGYGFLNKILIGLGLVSKPVQFLGSRWLLLLVVSIVVVWRSVPFMALVCLAGRQSIPDAIYEAAKMDGAGRLKRMLYIDLPMLVPTMIIIFILKVGYVTSAGGSAMSPVFEKVFLMQNDLNLSSSEVIATYVYKIGLKSQQYSYSAAIGLFNTLISFTLVVVMNRISKKLTGAGLW